MKYPRKLDKVLKPRRKVDYLQRDALSRQPVSKEEQSMMKDNRTIFSKCFEKQVSNLEFYT